MISANGEKSKIDWYGPFTHKKNFCKGNLLLRRKTMLEKEFLAGKDKQN